MVASFQSTIFPLNQIVPVPGNGMMLRILLPFPAERTDVGAAWQRLAAFPAEFRFFSFARFESRLNVLDVFSGGGRRRDGGGTPWPAHSGRRARGQDGVEQIGDALIPRRDISGDRF